MGNAASVPPPAPSWRMKTIPPSTTTQLIEDFHFGPRPFEVKAEERTQLRLAQMSVWPSLKEAGFKEHAGSKALAAHTMAVWGVHALVE